eukprot:jgi/Mesvir1/18710/Mv25342-RA.1
MVNHHWKDPLNCGPDQGLHRLDSRRCRPSSSVAMAFLSAGLPNCKVDTPCGCCPGCVRRSKPRAKVQTAQCRVAVAKVRDPIFFYNKICFKTRQPHTVCDERGTAATCFTLVNGMRFLPAKYND